MIFLKPQPVMKIEQGLCTMSRMHFLSGEARAAQWFKFLCFHSCIGQLGSFVGNSSKRAFRKTLLEATWKHQQLRSAFDTAPSRCALETQAPLPTHATLHRKHCLARQQERERIPHRASHVKILVFCVRAARLTQPALKWARSAKAGLHWTLKRVLTEPSS